MSVEKSNFIFLLIEDNLYYRKNINDYTNKFMLKFGYSDVLINILRYDNDHVLIIEESCLCLLNMIDNRLVIKEYHDISDLLPIEYNNEIIFICKQKDIQTKIKARKIIIQESILEKYHIEKDLFILYNTNHINVYNIDGIKIRSILVKDNEISILVNRHILSIDHERKNYNYYSIDSPKTDIKDIRIVRKLDRLIFGSTLFFDSNENVFYELNRYENSISSYQLDTKRGITKYLQTYKDKQEKYDTELDAWDDDKYKLIRLVNGKFLIRLDTIVYLFNIKREDNNYIEYAIPNSIEDIFVTKYIDGEIVNKLNSTIPVSKDIKNIIIKFIF